MEKGERMGKGGVEKGDMRQKEEGLKEVEGTGFEQGQGHKDTGHSCTR